MLKFRLVLLSLSVLMIETTVNAQITEKKGGYLIFVKYKKGQVIKQEMVMHVANSKMKTESQFVTKCLGVDSNGISTLQVTVPASDKGKSIKKTVKVDRHGKPQGKSIDGFSSNFVWPETPVKIGEIWDGDMNLGGSSGQGSMSLRSTYKLVGIKTVSGVKVASISTVMKVTGTYDMSGTGTINVRFRDGQIHNSVFNMSLNTGQSGSTKLQVVMTIRTLP